MISREKKKADFVSSFCSYRPTLVKNDFDHMWERKKMLVFYLPSSYNLKSFFFLPITSTLSLKAIGQWGSTSGHEPWLNPSGVTVMDNDILGYKINKQVCGLATWCSSSSSSSKHYLIIKLLCGILIRE